MAPEEVLKMVDEMIEEIKTISDKDYVRIPAHSISDEAVELLEERGYTVELEEDVLICGKPMDLYRVK